MGSELRAIGDRVLLIRVHDRGKLIAHVHEVMGITDRVLQLGEVVGLGPVWTNGRLRRFELKEGDLVVYPSPRIYDHFEHYIPGKGTQKILIVPGDWIAAIVPEGFLAENPQAREYGRPLE